MKPLLLSLILFGSSTPVMAQQVNNFAVCTQNQEVYQKGGYDQYGNYIPGGVNVQTYNVPCNQISQAYIAPPAPYYNNGYYPNAAPCRPIPTLLGALLGGGIAAGVSSGDAYKWSVPVGAAVGGAAVGCLRYW